MGRITLAFCCERSNEMRPRSGRYRTSALVGSNALLGGNCSRVLLEEGEHTRINRCRLLKIGQMARIRDPQPPGAWHAPFYRLCYREHIRIVGVARDCKYRDSNVL